MYTSYYPVYITYMGTHHYPSKTDSSRAGLMHFVTVAKFLYSGYVYTCSDSLRRSFLYCWCVFPYLVYPRLRVEEKSHVTHVVFPPSRHWSPTGLRARSHLATRYTICQENSRRSFSFCPPFGFPTATASVCICTELQMRLIGHDDWCQAPGLLRPVPAAHMVLRSYIRIHIHTREKKTKKKKKTTHTNSIVTKHRVSLCIGLLSRSYICEQLETSRGVTKGYASLAPFDHYSGCMVPQFMAHGAWSAAAKVKVPHSGTTLWWPYGRLTRNRRAQGFLLYPSLIARPSAFNFGLQNPGKLWPCSLLRTFTIWFTPIWILTWHNWLLSAL